MWITHVGSFMFLADDAQFYPCVGIDVISVEEFSEMVTFGTQWAGSGFIIFEE